MIIHLFGKPSVGKTTIGNKLKDSFDIIDLKSIIIDSDDLRKTLNVDLQFNKSDRLENIRRLFSICDYLESQNFIIIVCAINPYEVGRRSDYINIWLDGELKDLISRDSHGLYKKALLDKNDSNYLPNFTGISDVFETTHPTIYLNTSKLSISESVDKIISYVLPKIEINPDEPRAMYVGRFQPFHKGHEWLISEQLNKNKKILIGVRNMIVSPINPLNAYQTAFCIKKVFPQQTVVVKVIPDIESFNYGRNVGYEVIEFIPPENIHNISGTEIRNSKSLDNVSPLLHDLLNFWL